MDNFLNLGPRYYDKYLRPLTMTEWAKLLEDNSEYKIIEQTKLWWGGWVSTVWLGLELNYNFSPSGPPLIFETMVFGRGHEYVDQVSYSGLAEARNGHIKMVRKWGRWNSLFSYIFKN